LVMHPLVSIVQGLEVASTAEAAKDETVNASSTSDGYSGSSYKCYLPLNCYAGHGADEIDYIHIEEGASISACAKACNEMLECEGFRYNARVSSPWCWRRRNINLPACVRGQWNTESSEFITCLKPSCKPQGQSCEKSGDCCDDNVCKSLLGGTGKVCIAPPPPPCKPQGQSCEKSGDCCDDNVCKSLLGGTGKVCIAPPPPPCKPQGQSCEKSGDCCDDNVCKSLLGGTGKVCIAPPPPPCVAPGARCSPTCPGCPVQQCCGRSSCQALHHGDDSVCVL